MEEDFIRQPRKGKGEPEGKKAKTPYAPKKIAAPIPENSFPEVFVAPNADTPSYIVSAIKSGMVSRTLEMISQMDGTKSTVVIPMKHPLSYQLVIGDVAYLENGELTGIVERKNLLARYK